MEMNSKEQIVLLMCLVIPYSLTSTVGDRDCSKFVITTEMARDTSETFEHVQKHVRILKIDAKQIKSEPSDLNSSTDHNVSTFTNTSSEGLYGDMFLV